MLVQITTRNAGNRGRTAILVLLVAASWGCGGDGGDGDGSPDTDVDAAPDADADSDEDAGDPPVPEWEPGRLDPGFEVDGLAELYLIGNAATPESPVHVTVRAPEGTARVEVWVDEAYAGALDQGDGAFVLSTFTPDLGPGEHHLVMAADGAGRAFAALPFTMTHPLYIVVTNDWDDVDNSEWSFGAQEELHEWHPELRLTHFVGPYTFTDPTVTEDRRDEIVEWLLRMRDDYTDEIGLHIHPYCSFVEAAGLACRTEHSFAYEDGDTTGYTIFLGEYDEEESVTLFETASEIFVERGLGRPTSFRAGGWTTELHTLRAMARTGYVADTSAVSWARLEEWEGVPGTELFEWNREQWSTIGDTSQPYYPSQDDILSSEPPTIPVLEVPDNGALVDYVVSAEMIDVFEANWSGGALAEPRQVSIGYHPPNFNAGYQERLHNAMTHFDQFLASSGDGPVVYATLSELVLVWPHEDGE
jgi:hypothetical protein